MSDGAPDPASYPHGIEVICHECGRVRFKDPLYARMWWYLPDEKERVRINELPHENKLCPECLNERIGESSASGEEIIEFDALKKKLKGNRYFEGTWGEQTDFLGDD